MSTYFITDEIKLTKYLLQTTFSLLYDMPNICGVCQELTFIDLFYNELAIK